MSEIPFLFFVSTRYWTDHGQLEEAFGKLKTALAAFTDRFFLIVDGNLSGLPERERYGVLIPLSGAVQQAVLQAAEHLDVSTLYSAYCDSSFEEDILEGLLYRNAAPTLMDTWSVLRRGGRTMLAVTRPELEQIVNAMRGCAKIDGAKLILIGGTEPWVVSNASSPEVYEARFGVRIERVLPEEVIHAYEETSSQDAEKMVRHFGNHAEGMIGPTKEALVHACRFGTALKGVFDAHGAVGGAVACFDLIGRTGVSSCLGVSHINDGSGRFLACEGDLDSAVTMLLMKQFAQGPLWMANPCLDPSGLVQFSHCTAPWHLSGYACSFLLRTHHESGRSVGLQVAMPVGQPLTLCRISAAYGAMTVHTGLSVAGERKPVCHTQMWVRLDDERHYLDTALGCHQVIAFEEIGGPLTIAAKLLGLTLE